MPLESLDEVVVLFFEAVPVVEVTSAEADSQCFASICWADSASRCSNSCIVTSSLESFLACAVSLDLNLRDKMGASGHLQAALVVDTILIELRKLIEHATDVDNDAVAEDVLAARVQDAARQ